MALNPNALVDLATMKAFLKVPSTTTNQDSLIEDFINEASGLIETFCNRKFIKPLAPYIAYMDGARNNILLLPQWPVISITELNYDLDRVFGTDTIIPSSEYQILQDESFEGVGLEWFKDRFNEKKKVIKVTFDAGYDTISNVPSDLKLGCKITAAFYYLKQQQEDWTVSTKNKGDENISLIEGIPSSAMSIIEKYKRLEVYAPPASERNR